MRVESTIKPKNKFEIEIKGNLCDVAFFDEIKKITRTREEDEDVTEETVYTYQKYTLETVYRENLAKEIKDNFQVWLEFVKGKDYDTKASEVRAIRDKLLSETDKEMVIDRLGLDLPSNITATTMLSAVKNFFSGISSVVSGDMAKYRQALRDITKQEEFPYIVIWPEEPKK